ncbi:hypothetical protein DMENIID0001_061440 [Sergentomyia squamirostris]
MNDQITKMETEISSVQAFLHPNEGEETENVGDLLTSWNTPEIVVQKVLALKISLEDMKQMQPTDLDFMFPQDEAHLKAKLRFRTELSNWKYKNISSKLNPETTIVSLNEILQSSNEGLEILEECGMPDGCMNGKSQKQLVKCVAEYFLGRGILPSLNQLSAIANDIVEKFPWESKVVFFEPQGLLCRKIKALKKSYVARGLLGNQESHLGLDQNSDDDEMADLDENDEEPIESEQYLDLKKIISTWNLSEPFLVYRKLKSQGLTLEHLRLIENSNIDEIFRKGVRENIEFKREVNLWKNSLKPNQDQAGAASEESADPNNKMNVEPREDEQLKNQLLQFDLTYPDFVYNRLMFYGVDLKLMPHLVENDLCGIFKLSRLEFRSRVELRRELKIYVAELERQERLQSECSCETENNELNPRQLPRSLPTLNEVLQDCPNGVTLYAKKNQALEDDDKRDLVQIIVQHVVQKGITMNQTSFQHFADEIQRVFTQERKEHYYRHRSEDGRQSGRLYNKYRNDGRRIRRILQRSNNRV